MLSFIEGGRQKGRSRHNESQPVRPSSSPASNRESRFWPHNPIAIRQDTTSKVPFARQYPAPPPSPRSSRVVSARFNWFFIGRCPKLHTYSSYPLPKRNFEKLRLKTILNNNLNFSIILQLAPQEVQILFHAVVKSAIRKSGIQLGWKQEEFLQISLEKSRTREERI